MEMIKFNNHREDNSNRMDNDETSSKEDISLINSHFQCFQDNIKEFLPNPMKLFCVSFEKFSMYSLCRLLVFFFFFVTILS